MKVTNNNGLISITEMTVTEAEVLMIAILNGAESRKSCEEPSRILRRLGMQIDKMLPPEPPLPSNDEQLQLVHLFNQRNQIY